MHTSIYSELSNFYYSLVYYKFHAWPLPRGIPLRFRTSTSPLPPLLSSILFIDFGSGLQPAAATEPRVSLQFQYSTLVPILPDFSRSRAGGSVLFSNRWRMERIGQGAFFRASLLQVSLFLSPVWKFEFSATTARNVGGERGVAFRAARLNHSLERYFYSADTKGKGRPRKYLRSLGGGRSRLLTCLSPSRLKDAPSSSRLRSRVNRQGEGRQKSLLIAVSLAGSEIPCIWRTFSKRSSFVRHRADDLRSWFREQRAAPPKSSILSRCHLKARERGAEFIFFAI